MKTLNNLSAIVLLILLTFGIAADANAQKKSAKTQSASNKIQQSAVEAHMNFLAGDAMQGRGSGTEFELIAGEYFASLMRQFGVEPGAIDKSGNPTYIQTISSTRNTFAAPPILSFDDSIGTKTLTHGKDIIVSVMRTPEVLGKLRKIEPDGVGQSGDFLLIGAENDPNGEKVRANFQRLMSSGVSAILIGETPDARKMWEQLARRPVSYSVLDGKEEKVPALVILDADSYKKFSEMGEGARISLTGKLGNPVVRQTWNSVGKIQGSDPKLKSQVIVLSAHMDHLGIDSKATGQQDRIFNGADDDASGCTAVIELARILAGGGKPKRSVYFAFFGSEESGGSGAKYFLENLGFPKENVIADLQWEMIGRPDPKVKPDELWLTGFERSNLGSTLAQRGAKLVPDPYPNENFFQRSDNYRFAKEGIIAHTVSSFGLHDDYHRKSDEISKIDFGHMTKSINSMVAPIQWLVNSNFTPEWKPGMRP